MKRGLFQYLDQQSQVLSLDLDQSDRKNEDVSLRNPQKSTKLSSSSSQLELPSQTRLSAGRVHVHVHGHVIQGDNEHERRYGQTQDASQKLISPYDLFDRYLCQSLPIAKLEVDCSFDLSLLQQQSIGRHPYHAHCSQLKQVIEASYFYCHPCPKLSPFVNKSLQSQISSSSSLSYEPYDTANRDDAFNVYNMRRVDWQETIQQLMSSYFDGVIDSFYLQSNLFASSPSPSLDSIPDTYFMKSAKEQAEIEYICLIEKAPKSLIRRLLRFQVYVRMIHSDTSETTKIMHEQNHMLWSRHGLIEHTIKGESVLIQGKYAIRLLVNLYLEILSSTAPSKRRTATIELPYIVSYKAFHNSVLVSPVIKALALPRVSEDILASEQSDSTRTSSLRSMYKFEISGCLTSAFLLSLVNMLMEYEPKDVLLERIKGLRSIISSSAADVSWTKKPSQSIANTQPPTTQSMTAIAPKNPFEIISAPAETFSSLFSEETVLSADAGKATGSRHLIMNREEWLVELQRSGGGEGLADKYFHIRIRPYLQSLSALSLAHSKCLQSQSMQHVKDIAWRSNDTDYDRNILIHTQLLPQHTLSDFRDQSINLSQVVIITKDHTK
jgi:hypothetical protein